MKKSIKAIIAVCVTAGAVSLPRLSAQTYSHDPQQACLQQENIWLRSSNPSSIGVMDMPDVGAVRFTGTHLSGKLHRAMDTAVKNGWGFGADSYKALRHLNLWGDFSFRNNRHTGRKWSDNFNPYNGNPYQAGSNVKGDYIEQTFDFGVRISSKRLFDRLWFGLGFDYSLGDLSRINDPRSRVQFADMSLTPGLIVEVARQHRLGFHFNYRYRKEKNNKYVTKSDLYNEFFIYRQEGLGVYSKILSNRFERRVKGQWFGGGLQYEFGKTDFSLLAELLYNRHSDSIEDLIQESPGNWAAHEAALDLTARWKDTHSTQTILLHGAAELGSAQKYFQEMKKEAIPGTDDYRFFYETVLEVKAFTQDKAGASLSYEYLRRKNADALWWIRPGITWSYLHDRYSFYVPASDRECSSLQFSIDGVLRLLSKNRHRLYAGLSLGYLLNLSASLFLSPDINDPLIADEVIRPDYSWYTSDVARIALDLRYIFPVSKKINGFVQLEGTELISTSLARHNRHFADIAVGILHRF